MKYFLPYKQTLQTVLLLTFLFTVVSSSTTVAQNILAPLAPKNEKTEKSETPVDPTKPADFPTPESIKDKRAEVQQTLKSLQKQPDLYKDQISLLSFLDAALARQEESLTVWDFLTNEKATLAKSAALHVEAQLNEKFTKPYDLAKLDSLYDAQELLTEGIRQALDAAVQSEALLLQDQKDFQKSEESRRLAKERPQDSSLSTSTTQIQSQLDQAKLTRSTMDAANAKLRKDNFEIRDKNLAPQISYVRENLELTDELWRKIKREYDIKELSIKESLKDLQKDLAAQQKNLESFTASSIPSPSTQTRIESSQVALLAAQREVVLNETWLEQVRLTREIMRNRYDLYTKRADHGEKKVWAQKMQDNLDRLEPQYDFLTTSLLGAQKKLEGLRTRNRESTDQAILAFTEATLRHQNDLIVSFQEELWSTKAVIQLSSRFLAELNMGKNRFEWQTIQDNTWNFLKTLWLKELFQLEDRAFRISTLAGVLFWLAIGLVVAWLTSSFVGKRILLHYGLACGAAAAYQKLFYYGVLVIFCIGIFEYFNFSLTSLTILSGALALGVGFGSQDIIKNFISGIILLFERPVNEGDIIQLDGDPVKVERIGARSTQVKALDNTQRIIPNSYLLENVIINWTLSDSVIRSSIAVGVAYGTSTRDVSKILLSAVRGIEGVHPEPAPEVLFTDFGDNALIFKVLFSSATTHRADLTSEARYRICDALDKAGISMPFPQRDLYLDSKKPLEFRILKGTTPSVKDAADPTKKE